MQFRKLHHVTDFLHAATAFLPMANAVMFWKDTDAPCLRSLAIALQPCADHDRATGEGVGPQVSKGRGSLSSTHRTHWLR